MKRVTDGFGPEKVLSFFEEICSIPHGSGNIKKISDHCVSFAKERNLKYVQDESGNVIIYKNGSPGLTDQAPVILQGHLDMVCETEEGCDKDLLNEGLDLYVEDCFLKARGTTLGGDDGIAVAMSLAILDDDELKLPPLEVLFTVDEEVGMLGATALDASVLSGKTLINIDSEVEGVFTLGCAGGMTAVAELPVKRESRDGEIARIDLTGFAGGHSGIEIDKGRANPDMVLGRLLDSLYKDADIRMIEIGGGSKDNAIPREAYAVINIPSGKFDIVRKVSSDLNDLLKKEYALTDPGIKITVNKTEIVDRLLPMDEDSVRRVICALRNLPNGIQSMSFDIRGLVETSLNLGIMKTDKDNVTFSFSVRSSIESKKHEIYSRIVNLIEMLGGNVRSEGEYPAWEYKNESLLRDVATEVFVDQYGHEPVKEVIHAGLECGILAGKIPGLDAISIGPDIKDIHTPKERLDLKSVERTYGLVIGILKKLAS